MISLAMIAKNEEKRIERAIRSVQGCIDEIVVVDTGSVDGTREIARKLGAEVLEHPFRGDFSEARNVSLSGCRGDWILVLDADEFFPLSPKVMLEAAVEESVGGAPNCYKGYYLLRHNYEETGQAVTYSDYVLRLFRNRPGVAFRHRVHETLEESLDLIEGKYTHVSAMPISHYLYEREAVYLDTKHERYVEGLKKDIADNPADAGRYDFLGCEYARLGRLEEAEGAFRTLLSLQPGHPGAMESLALVLRLKTG
ncbi:MAG: hypothetical protein A3G34_10235 [Candidatus Lindowbacteria bacterium RIFCSPLOWO2_12_FULL_62_27]|nr:MAG: hypothetical protein A3G34_10235 [Candidatus Lindowbacteria bacterium RIFCSPLOWO2_12_FULL_62_27]OGH61616.1 MAG: hypothetical protein A3I06_03245 [Candidatus Lindowbacteria bacterium RIFCSPLOWO2_02_FULL_62_12]